MKAYWTLVDAYEIHTAYAYGTAGFRMRGEDLLEVMPRVALLAALKMQVQDSKYAGIMITASHNPACDNGVKVVDGMGDMLSEDWEEIAVSLANASDLKMALEDIVQKKSIEMPLKPGTVVIGRDTRPGGKQLEELLVKSLECLGIKSLVLGQVSTPLVHHMTRAYSTGVVEEQSNGGYYQKMASAFKNLVKENYTLKVDCANGVGAIALREIQEYLDITFTPYNTDVTAAEKLNLDCGADYVKTKVQFPVNLANIEPLVRVASFDGDADRLVYFYKSPTGDMRLLDGDKIATLAALYIGDLVKQAGVQASVGIVQTAYANGNSTKYIQSQALPVQCVPTGVKHLHHAAASYDVGIYFEANGHGTVLFSNAFVARLKSSLLQVETPLEREAITNLLSLHQLINQTVGDAISDMLLVEVILSTKKWDVKEWDAMYEDFPSRLVKVLVPSRELFLTTDAERKLTSPAGLQQQIDELVQQYQDGRAFVRPSGTENCVRVYAEARTRVEADDLAKKVSDLTLRASEK